MLINVFEEHTIVASSVDTSRFSFARAYNLHPILRVGPATASTQRVNMELGEFGESSDEGDILGNEQPASESEGDDVQNLRTATQRDESAASSNQGIHVSADQVLRARRVQ